MKEVKWFMVLLFMLIVACGMLEIGLAQKEACKPAPSDTLVSVINNKCLRCHKAEFSNKEDICAKKSSIIDSVATGRMPKMGKLSPEEKDTIVNWK